MADSSINAQESWKSSITTHLRRRDSGTGTIHKVPERIRRGEKDAYEPRIISFGPYYHGEANLRAMEEYKKSFLKVIHSFGPQIPREPYIKAIKDEEAKIRTCYTDDFGKFDSEKFVEMILIDCCFLVGYLLQLYYCGFPCELDLELDSIVGMHDLIQNDIMLLENQLPFFILTKIFELLELTTPSSFKELAICCLDRWAGETKGDFQPPESVHHLLHLSHSHCLYTSNPVSSHGEESGPIDQPPSSTVLPAAVSVTISEEKSGPMHQPPSATVLPAAVSVTIPEEESGPIPPSATVLPAAVSVTIPEEESGPIPLSATVHPAAASVTIPEEEMGPIYQPPSATVLHAAGVKFEKKEVNGSEKKEVNGSEKKEVNGSTLDVTFDPTTGKMMIPPLVIDTFNMSRLRNFVAFEQFYPNFNELSKSFTAYVEFMDFIVNTPEDVALLHKEGIITHFLGSDKNAADFLNDLNKSVFVKKDHYLAPLYGEVCKYHKKKKNKWLAMLRHNYCNTPWKVLGVVVGGILLVLTLLQTIFTGISTF